MKNWDNKIKRFRDENGMFTADGIPQLKKEYGNTGDLFDLGEPAYPANKLVLNLSNCSFAQMLHIAKQEDCHPYNFFHIKQTLKTWAINNADNKKVLKQNREVVLFVMNNFGPAVIGFDNWMKMNRAVRENDMFEFEDKKEEPKKEKPVKEPNQALEIAKILGASLVGLHGMSLVASSPSLLGMGLMFISAAYLIWRK